MFPIFQSVKLCKDKNQNIKTKNRDEMWHVADAHKHPEVLMPVISRCRINKLHAAAQHQVFTLCVYSISTGWQCNTAATWCKDR